MARTPAGVLLGLLLIASCERRAPGPEECVKFAEAALGVREEQVLRSPRLKRAFDELVVKCLTTPYDRELVDCVNGGRRPRQCLHEFMLRRAEPSVSPSPPALPPSEDRWR